MTDNVKVTDAEAPDTEETPREDDRPAIVHRWNVIDENGVQQQKEIRVPLEEWPAYEKEKGL